MTCKAEKILPYTNDNTPKGVQIKKMFDAISQRYDLLNHTLSFGLDCYWRKKGILSLKNVSPKTILDIATGTGDLALSAYRLLQPEHITGIDISDKMMQIGQEKASRAGLSGKIDFNKQDCMQLTFADNSFDAAMVAFGVRNFENLDKGLQEILRTLRPGGKLMILELSSPEHFPMKQAYGFYSMTIIPLIGRIVSGNKPAYRYLIRSIEAFPQGDRMKVILEKNGFCDVEYKKLTFGVCTLYSAYKR
ncbi:MAG: bifunctional demethylmenaquinone methyltransferase/2-methoxy-6-polyprenyl-1,4-benzoquinol methylase UbiE [Dysgonamonadaceae bacterium]|jgi:demethylmenaquinone methyltransferase/2-methoxy-6-polyprenyl-1,4-benzoquinol methylase|nr:bifunctional demethylmenaquinone methyltransferase/2-methoxy-6-polyprenyl-1,4-benzoquinol methylase UbiE [Dysgonamonadaceae bacterium]